MIHNIEYMNMDKCSKINDKLDATAIQLREIENDVADLDKVNIDANDYDTVVEMNNLMIRMLILNDRVKELMNKVIEKAEKVSDDFVKVIETEIKEVAEEDFSKDLE